MHEQFDQLDRDPVQGEDLASQPTLSRFENAIDVRSLDSDGRVITYGQQQLTFFNSHYANGCYLPVTGFVQFNDEPDQYLFCYVLRPGDVHASFGAIAILRRIIRKLRKHFPGVRIQARLDGGYATPEIVENFESEEIKYVIAVAKNAVLQCHTTAVLSCLPNSPLVL